jgi:transcriptional regulator with XRE-family HTH domain
MAGRDAVAGLSERLKSFREKAGLSQTQAGERSGVHHVSIAKFETDASVPTIATLYKLAEAYGVDVCDLLPESRYHATAKKTPTPPRLRDGAQKGKK